VAQRLDVYLNRDLVGIVAQDDHGDITFEYAESWLAGDRPIPLSQSLPLRPHPFSRKECAGYFGGILPEGENRETIAQNLGISAKNDVALLERIGGECAGAISFVPSGTALPAQTGGYFPLTEPELAEKLRQLPRRPLLAGEDHIRLSLAGVQDKLVVHMDEAGISIPLDAAPSTHILKPAIGHFEGLVVNERLCMRLAAAVGLSAATVQLARVEEIDYLVVERYDRARADADCLRRIHQEDFCQALGVLSERKYQAEGGPTIAQCVELLRKACTAPALDVLRFTDAVIFNFLIGNNDAHGKNYSLLYQGWPQRHSATVLAPLYDLVCTRFYPELSQRMAMKIGGEYQSDRVYPRHFDQLAEEAKLSRAGLRRRVLQLAQITRSRLPEVTSDDPTAIGVAEVIRQRCNHTMETFQT
jgi:serine/threonine-protein kinase HipA